MAEVVLVRHGQTEWSRDGRHTGRSDVPPTEQARATRPGWSVWGDDGSGLGETLAQLAARQDRVLARLRPVLERDEDVCLVGHGHALRVLAARWLGLEPRVGQQLVLSAASVSTLGFEHGCPAVLSWNG